MTATPWPTTTASTSTTTTTGVPAATTAGTDGAGGGVLGLLLTGAVLAAVIGAIVNTALARRKSLEEERARVRGVFAEAFEAVAAYKEFPYSIRRRRHDQPEAERVRIAEAMSGVQAKLSYYLAWTTAESAQVGSAYADLVKELRRVAGTACHDAWLAPAATTDADMNIPPTVVDLRGLKPLEDAYVAASREHLQQLLALRSLLGGRH
ncbi:hypothetical protein N802_11560 [Knoellia sinensis KCTC 19936]|uniref:Uncharacterized protein n=1 Tax=Knoellia sinensis KCTC 19936 TaxID=1385520 RepID=A0A0A0IZ12_9MICO|nr:hypothetical protein N802_11560 [Knoellia sinensis KCTC 19936]